MMKKYLGITLVATSLILFGCSSNDDGSDGMMAGDNTDSTNTDDTNTDNTNTDNTNTDDTNTDNVDATPIDFGNSVMGIVAAQPDLNLLEAAILDADDLATTVNDPNNTWTIFAPSDTALEGVSVDRAALLMHIHAGSQNVASLTGLVGSSLGMTGGSPQPITMSDDGTLQIGGVNIYQSDIVGDNGVVHKIDGVLQ